MESIGEYVKVSESIWKYRRVSESIESIRKDRKASERMENIWKDRKVSESMKSIRKDRKVTHCEWLKSGINGEMIIWQVGHGNKRQQLRSIPRFLSRPKHDSHSRVLSCFVFVRFLLQEFLIRIMRASYWRDPRNRPSRGRNKKIYHQQFAMSTAGD